MTQPGIPNHLVLSTSCYGSRLKTIEDQAFAAVAMGFRRLELGLSEAPVPLNGWEDSRRETGICVDSVVVGSLNPRVQNMSGSRLGAADAEQRERALNSSRRHIRLAQRMQAPIVVVRGCEVEDKHLAAEAVVIAEELEQSTIDTHEAACEKVRDFVHRVQKKGQRQLEHFCRSLHTLHGEFPETKIAIEPGLHFNDLLNFEAMQWTLDDLSKFGLGYWHDTGRIQLREQSGLPTQGQWLDTFAGRMLGVHLQDAAENRDELPPGQGEVDFKLVAEYLPAEAVRVVEMNECHGRAAILASVQFLMEHGF